MNVMLKKLIFDKESERVYCVNSDDERYAEFPISFNFWGNGGDHDAIDNGTYPVTNEDANALDYGYDMEPAYGRFWVALDRERGRGFHGYGEGRSLTSGTYGCIRGENSDGEQICEAIERSLNSGLEVTAEVVGDVDDSAFCLDGEGEQ